MLTIKAQVFIESSDDLNFTADDGKKIELERSVAYIQFPNSRFPEKVLINSKFAHGDYEANVMVQAKKDKLTASIDLDSMVLVKQAAKA